MSSSVALHTQLASIMEVLANAAVAEICELIDDGYAVLRAEISRSQKEIEALKRKVSFQTTELRIAKEVRFPTTERDFTSQLDISLWRDGMPAAGNDTQGQSTNSNESADTVKSRPQSVLIKKETLEEDLGSSLLGAVAAGQERAVACDVNESAPTAVKEPEPAIGADEVSEQPGTRRSVWEDSGLDTILKAEHERGTETLKDIGSEHAPRKLNGLSLKCVPYERSRQPQTLYSQPNASTEDLAYFYANASDSESLSTRTEPQLCPNADKCEGQASKEFLDVKLGAVVIDSAPNELGDALQETVEAKHSHSNKYGERDLLPENAANTYLPQSQLTIKENIAVSKSNAPDVIGNSLFNERVITQKRDKVHNKAGTREKRFICTFCGKSFTCPKNLETHQRVHTGEKPFRCSHCGKRFADSSNHKRHQITHTGERRYSCTLCGKRFTQSSCLISHQRVHTGERPFSCSQCGKRFADSSNLRRHQSVHRGKKPLRCTLQDEFNCFKAS